MPDHRVVGRIQAAQLHALFLTIGHRDSHGVAATINIADAVGLGAAIDYVTRVGIENIGHYEHDLLAYATSVLQPVPGVRLIGTAKG